MKKLSPTDKLNQLQLDWHLELQHHADNFPAHTSSDPPLSCPWCKRTDLALPQLKFHIKYCDKAPRPRGKEKRRRAAYTQREKGAPK